MRLSLQERYAVRGIFDLAYNGENGPIQVRVIGERQGIPSRYLEQIFQRLRRAHLIEGKRGPGGGYRLARPAAEITLKEVLEAVEGPLDRLLAPPGDESEGEERHRPDFIWSLLAERLGDVLADTTLAGMCRLAARRAVDRADTEGHMYHI